jgi:hypothetical protein
MPLHPVLPSPRLELDRNRLEVLLEDLGRGFHDIEVIPWRDSIVWLSIGWSSSQELHTDDNLLS